MSKRTIQRRSGTQRQAHSLFRSTPLLARPAVSPQFPLITTRSTPASASTCEADLSGYPQPPSRKQLRQQLRQRRRSLTPIQQRQAAVRMTRSLLSNTAVLGVRHLALYLPSDGEIDPSLLIPILAKRGIKLYLPVLRPYVENRLWFVRLTPQTRLTMNRFGIWEPETRSAAHPAKRLPAWALDMILMPLVGFDGNGRRLGMGGGFYDRSLSFMNNANGSTTRKRSRPLLAGLAHGCQQVDYLDTAPWDIPLQGVITEQRGWAVGKRGQCKR